MRDLTQGSITRHLFSMAAFIGAGLVVQTLYFLVDLYFVSRLGSAAIAGVSAAGNVWLVGMAAAQMIAIGALSLIARAVGAKDFDAAQRVFDQTLGLGLAAGVVALLLGYGFGPAGLARLGADAETATAARDYLLFFLPAIALMFPTAALGSGLRASGVVGAPMIIQSLTVVLNAVLAPVLISGWGTGVALGVAGAGLASSIATAAGLLATVALFRRMQSRLHVGRDMLRPRLALWGRITAIGAPAAGEFLLMFVITSVIYWVVRDFGAAAQAGYGVGSRIAQSVALPAMALAFAAAPIAGQNFGAGDGGRVRETFRKAAVYGAIVMLGLTLLCQIRPDLLVGPFAEDPQAATVAAGYLRIISWNFLSIGLVFACSGLFQALGDTRPALLSSASRLLSFVLPVLWLSRQPGFTLEQVWLLSAASVLVQAGVSLLLLRREFSRKLGALAAAPAAA